MANKENTLWTEKHRPEKLDDFVGDPHLKDIIGNYIKANDPPHLLFYGEPGTGKTTLSRIIVNNTDCDHIEISSNQTSIDVVRKKVKDFASVCGFSGLKVIVLDDFGYMSTTAQAELKSVIENFSSHTRFIFTSNTIEKIDEAIVSRTQNFELTSPSAKEVKEGAIKILKSEGIKFDDAELTQLVNSNYKDIRKTMGLLQQYCLNGELTIPKPKANKSELQEKLIKILKEGWTKKTIKGIQQLFADYQITDLPTVFSHLGDTAKYLAPNNVSEFLFNSEKLPFELIGLIHFMESRVDDKDRTVELSLSEIKSIGNGVSTQKTIDLIGDLLRIGYIKRKDKQISQRNRYVLSPLSEFKQDLEDMDPDFVNQIRKKRNDEKKRKYKKTG